MEEDAIFQTPNVIPKKEQGRRGRPINQKLRLRERASSMNMIDFVKRKRELEELFKLMEEEQKIFKRSSIVPRSPAKKGGEKAKAVEGVNGYAKETDDEKGLDMQKIFT